MEPEQWRAVLEMFLQNNTSSKISVKTGQNIKQVFRAISYARMAMSSEIPLGFNEIAPNTRMLKFDPLETTEILLFGLMVYKNHLWFSYLKNSSQVIEPVTGIEFSAFLSKDTFEIVDKDSNIKKELENFWASQKEFLTGRSGHRSEKLGLYLAEAIWRHNHRKQSCASLVEHLLKLIGQAWNERNQK
jgi:hypothetical protein